MYVGFTGGGGGKNYPPGSNLNQSRYEAESWTEYRPWYVVSKNRRKFALVSIFFDDVSIFSAKIDKNRGKSGKSLASDKIGTKID